MMKHVQAPSVKQRVGALVAAGALAMSSMGAPFVAFADDAQPSTPSQTGTGATEVTIEMLNNGVEVGGTEDDNNKDNDNPPDGLGDNIAFTVPTQINFAANASGKLIGPSAESTYIENESVFAIHASSLQVNAENGWNIVSDATATTQANSIDFQVGPANDMLDASSYLSKGTIDKQEEWNMSSRQAGASATGDRVLLQTSGDVANVSDSVTSKVKVATMHWYVTRGVA